MPNLPPDPPHSSSPTPASVDPAHKINVTEPPTTNNNRGRWRFGDIDLGPLPAVADLVTLTTDSRTGPPCRRHGVRVAYSALNLDKAERLCRFHAVVTGNPDTGSSATKVWPCDSMQEPYCGTNNLADRRQEAVADLRARGTVHVGTVAFTAAKRKAINQAEGRAGAVVWHLPMARPHVVVDEWETGVAGRAETPEVWVIFSSVPYSTKGVTWVAMAGPDAADLFDICCAVPFVPKVPRRAGVAEVTPATRDSRSDTREELPASTLVLDPTGFAADDPWEADDSPMSPGDVPADLEPFAPDFTAEWQVEAGEYRLRKRRQHDLFDEAADVGADELGWTPDQIARARRGYCPRGVLFCFWWSLLEHLVAEDKTRRLAQFATYSTEAPDRTDDEVRVSGPAAARGGA